MFYYICVEFNLWCVCYQRNLRRNMYSPEFMKFLINYQKDEFTPEPTKKEIYFRPPRKGRKTLAEIVLPVLNK